MENNRCPYEVLGVGRDADADAIRAAYRARARTLHPDAGGSAAAMAELNAAKDLLLDPELRAHYDRTGETDAGEINRPQALYLQALDAVLRLLDKDDAPEYRDVATLAGDLLTARIKELHQATAGLRAQEQKLRRLAGRSRRKGAGADLIEGVLTQRRLDVIARQVAMEADLEDFKAALVIAQDHDYQAAERPQQTFTWSIPTASSSSSI